MADLTVHFEVEKDADGSSATQHIEQSLQGMTEVHTANVRLESYRGVGMAEVIAGVSLAVTVIGSAGTAVEAVTKFINSVKDLVKAGKGLHDALIDVGFKKVPVSQITPADIQKLAQKASA